MPQHHESFQNPLDIKQNFLINQIASGLVTTTDLIKNLSIEIKNNAVELATIKADLNNVIDDVRTLSKILREGNGTAPVLSRIAVLEATVLQLNTAGITLTKNLDKTKEKLDILATKVSDVVEIKKDDKKNRWQVIIAILTGIITLVTGIILALIN